MKKFNVDLLEHNNLMLLVESNNETGVRAYISKFSSGINDEKKSLAFLYSCKIGRIEIAKILLDCVNPNSRHADGQTALMLLSQISKDLKEKSEFLELLIERGCDVDLVDFCGKSALHWAVIENCLWSTRIFINRSNVNSIDLIGMNPLMYAAKYDFCAIVSLLLHAGADPTKSTKQQGSAIHLAIRHRSNGALQQMIPFCRHWNILNSRNQSPLDLAILLDNFESVRILMESKKEIEINRRPSFAPFRTPLEEACFRNNLEIVTILLSAGANVNYSLDYAFETEKQDCRSKPIAPLIFAISRQNLKMTELLLAHGADIDIRCPKSPGYVVFTSPLALATELGNREIFDLLHKNRKQSDEEAIGESFSAACVGNNIDVVLQYLNQSKINPIRYRLKNGLPVILDLVKYCIKDNNIEKLYDLNKDFIRDLVTPEIISLLNRKNFGSSMQLYREAWLQVIALFYNDQLELSEGIEDYYLQFIITFLEFFFLIKKIEDDQLINEKLTQINIFPIRLIRRATHSSNLLKSVLLSKSIYALTFLIEMHLDEKYIFWDKKVDQTLNLSEFALFFDNIDAALVLNLACGTSLNWLIEYETFPYIPDIINPSIEYNEIDKIKALQYLSHNVKPLKTLCKYTIRRYINTDSCIETLSNLSKSLLDDLYLNFSEYICNFDNSQNSAVRYFRLCKWAGIDPTVLNFINF